MDNKVVIISGKLGQGDIECTVKANDIDEATRILFEWGGKINIVLLAVRYVERITGAIYTLQQ
jgi:hypothetical protein